MWCSQSHGSRVIGHILPPDGSQPALCHLIFCLWFLALGVVGIWYCAGYGAAGSRWQIKPQESKKSPPIEADWYAAGAQCARLWFSFAIRARRLIEGTGKDTGKGLLRIKAVFQADIINPLVGISQVARRQQQFYARECSARDFPLCTVSTGRCRCCISNTRRWRAISSIRSG